jgi:AcrR family transcriptional regulator
MASSRTGSGGRLVRRRQAVVDQALNYANDVMVELGVGGLSVSEVARRLGMRGPSLYKYFPSLHALYDALFARGLEAHLAAMRAAAEQEEPGVARLRAAGRALVAWSVENPALAQLLFWRPVPGFEPSPATFAASVEDMAQARAELAEAVRRGQLTADADSDAALRLYTVVLSGLISQQLANQPGVPFETGTFTALTDDALDLFFDRYTASRRN